MDLFRSLLDSCVKISLRRKVIHIVTVVINRESKGNLVFKHMKWVGVSLEQRDWIPELVILRKVGKLLEDPSLTSTIKTQTNIATSTQTSSCSKIGS